MPLQASVTQALRHEGDSLVQVSSSRLSSFTQLQRSGSTTTGRDASGALVSLASRWEGDAWVVLSHAAGSGAAALPLETRRWLEPGNLTMRFDVTTAAADGSGARVTARRRLHRVSWEPEDVPTPQQAQAGVRTVPGTAWSLLFGSAEPDGNDGAEH